MRSVTSILVTDDNATTLETLSAGLDDLGYRVTTAANGQEALALIKRQPFSIVIADIKLPDISGLEILETAKELNVKILTIYVFSNENWKRPRDEIRFLMGLVKKFVENKLAEIKEKGVKVVHSGDIEKLPDSARKSLEKALRETAGNKKW